MCMRGTEKGQKNAVSMRIRNTKVKHRRIKGNKKRKKKKKEVGVDGTVEG